MRGNGCASIVLKNGGRKARKKMDSFGLRMFDEDSRDDDVTRRFRPRIGLDLQRTVLLQRHPRHVDQVGDAEHLQRLESERARMQHGGEPEHGGGDVRHDAERAAEGGDDAGAAAARQAGGEREENACAGRDDDDQRGQQEIEAHKGGLPGCGPMLAAS
jgi:hypothetical protein